jgi:alpha-N-arabinofuranosidase
MPALSGTASRNQAGQVHLTLANLDPNRSLTVTCTVHGQTVKPISGRILTAETIDAHNTFDQPNLVQPSAFDGVTIHNGNLAITLPAKAVVALVLG